MSRAIQEIEAFVRPFMGIVIAHDYKHVDRVRCHAKQIAQPTTTLFAPCLNYFPSVFYVDAAERHLLVVSTLCELA